MYRPQSVKKETEIFEQNLYIHLDAFENISLMNTILNYEEEPEEDFEESLMEIYLDYFKVRNEDLNKIKTQLNIENMSLINALKSSDLNNDEIVREIKIVTKEKIENINDKIKAEEELSKFQYNDTSSIITSNQFTENNKGRLSTSVLSIKDKYKKIKDLKSQLSRMERTLVDAKKSYDEKKKKNEIYIKNNEHLTQTVKQKGMIIEQIKVEIDNCKDKIEEVKLDKDDASSFVSKSTGVSININTDKKGFVGFVKNFFKKK